MKQKLTEINRLQKIKNYETILNGLKDRLTLLKAGDQNEIDSLIQGKIEQMQLQIEEMESQI
jgi:hypothetical protein